MSTKGDSAHKWASEIFSLSTKCWLSNVIQAVETYLEESGEPAFRFPHRIKVREVKEMQISTGHRALIDIKQGWSLIIIDSSLWPEAKQLAIAHELAHLLFAKSRFGDGKRVVRDRETESACKIFENQIGQLLHAHFSSDITISSLKFPSLNVTKLAPND